MNEKLKQRVIDLQGHSNLGAKVTLKDCVQMKMLNGLEVKSE